MNEDRLHLLARRAGLSLRWIDYLGSEREVSPDVLRRALAALHLPADSGGEIDQSLEQLDVAARLTIPEMLVGRAGVPTVLPPALHIQPQQIVRVQLEHGDEIDVRASLGADGQTCLDAIAQIGYHRLEIVGASLILAMAPAQGFTMADLGDRRRFGLTAQLYGLRRGDDFGIGDFAALGELAVAAAARGADALAISPTHALFSADPSHFSPYSPSSRLFLNVLHADIDHLVSDTALRQWIVELGLGPELERLRHLDLIDWTGTARAKQAVLRKLWSQLGPRWAASDHMLAKSYRTFCELGGVALRDHTRFEALHAAQFGKSEALWHWRNWAPQLRDSNSEAVAQFAREHADDVDFHGFLQWLAAKGCSAAQRAARDAGMAIGLIADLAVGTADGGSHVWSRPDDFLRGLAAGAPPDAINTHGQNWGLTTFSPVALRTRSYAPFIDTLRAVLRHSGGLRIDHILGIRRLWVTPEGAEASDGVYLAYPEQDLLALIALESARHRAIIIGEDLGTVPPGFSDMIGDAGLLGMQVLWFQRDQSFFIEPGRWSARAMATTTTHDLPTVAGWWRGVDIERHAEIDMLPTGSSSESAGVQRTHDRHMLWGALLHAGVAAGEQPLPEQSECVVDAALQFVARTPSPLAMFPLDDICGISEQPNLPGTIDQHPNWRRRLPLSAPAMLQQPAAEQRLEAIRQIRAQEGN